MPSSKETTPAPEVKPEPIEEDVDLLMAPNNLSRNSSGPKLNLEEELKNAGASHLTDHQGATHLSDHEGDKDLSDHEVDDILDKYEDEKKADMEADEGKVEIIFDEETEKKKSEGTPLIEKDLDDKQQPGILCCTIL